MGGSSRVAIPGIARPRVRSDELEKVNDFLESVLSSLRDGVAVVDRDLHVENWNDRAEDLWGLDSVEVRGKDLRNLDIGLPLEELRQSIRACMNGDSPFEYLTVDATNRRGKMISCRVTCTPMSSNGEIRGVILVMEENEAARPGPRSEQ